MKTRNDVIRSVREICGIKEDDGYFLYTSEVKVPNYVFKDTKVEYPEIRISPFISNNFRESFEKQLTENCKIKRFFYDGVFQIDIFSKKIPELTEILEVLESRFDDFNNPEIIIGNHDRHETVFKDGYYLNKHYTLGESVLNKITINDEKIKQVKSFSDLKDDSWFLGKNGLYVKLSKDKKIKDIKIYILINGKLFHNGKTAREMGILKINPINFQELSDLESNDVERMSFELQIRYSLDKVKKMGPVIERISTHVKGK